MAKLSQTLLTALALLCSMAGIPQSYGAEGERLNPSSQEKLLRQLTEEFHYADIVHLSLQLAVQSSCPATCQAHWLRNAGRAALRSGNYQAAASYLKFAWHEDNENTDSRDLLAYVYLLENEPLAYSRLVDSAKLASPKEQLRWHLLEVMEASSRHSAASLEQMRRFTHDELPAKVSTLVGNYTRVERKSPLVAGLANMIPGAGYIYLGMYQSAVISFTLTAVSVASAVELFRHRFYLAGSGVALLASVFYGGGLLGAAESANNINDKNTAPTRSAIRSWALPALEFRWQF